MKLEEINALYEAQSDRFDAVVCVDWPALYRELMAARALRHRALNGDDHAEVSELLDEYDAARRETDK